MKKLISLILALTLVCLLAAPALAAQVDPVEPAYTETKDVNVTLTISASGSASVKVYCRGSADVTKITATTYIQKKMNGNWVRIAVDGVSSWSDSASGARLAEIHTAQLSGSGEYRAVSTFVVTGKTTETIVSTGTDSY